MKRCIYSYLVIVTMLSLLFTSCEDEVPTTPDFETGQLTDVDGNVYKTVKIGDQWWMAENLAVTHFRNGQPIFEAQTAGDWEMDSSSYCVYQDNEAAPGLLYNWSAVNNPNHLAPQGWHIPTDAEWRLLEEHLGMSSEESLREGWRGSDEGEQLRIAGTEGWVRFEEIWATNSSGFSALAGGCRLWDGTWSNPGLFQTGYWWTATETDAQQAMFRHMDYKNPEVFRFMASQKYGMSIRCVMD